MIIFQVIEMIRLLNLRARFKNEMNLQYEAYTKMSRRITEVLETFEMRLTVFYDGKIRGNE